jgi:hypothetical protein
LGNNCQLLAQSFEGYLLHIQSVDVNDASLDFNNPTQSETDGALAGASPSNDSDFLTSLDVEAETFEDLVGLWSVPEVDILESDIACCWPLFFSVYRDFQPALKSLLRNFENFEASNY